MQRLAVGVLPVIIIGSEIAAVEAVHDDLLLLLLKVLKAAAEVGRLLLLVEVQ